MLHVVKGSATVLAEPGTSRNLLRARVRSWRFSPEAVPGSEATIAARTLLDRIDDAEYVEEREREERKARRESEGSSMIDEQELEQAQDRLSQKLGVRVDLDDDLVLLMAAFARDALIDDGHEPADDLRESVREWLQA